jgi:hypothetical protein
MRIYGCWFLAYSLIFFAWCAWLLISVVDRLQIRWLSFLIGVAVVSVALFGVSLLPLREPKQPYVFRLLSASAGIVFGLLFIANIAWHLGGGQGGVVVMAWVTSLLADYAGEVDMAWLRPSVTVEQFLAPFVDNARTYLQPQIRAEDEAAIAADRRLLEDVLEMGDELRPWHLGNTAGVGRAGLAVLREGRVIRAWKTAVLISA